MIKVRKRPDGRWEGRFRGPDARFRSVYAKTKGEAEKLLRAALDERDAGLAPTDGRLTTGAYLERWLATSVRMRCKPRTVASYEETVRRYIAPHVGSVPLVKLRPEHVRAMLAALAATSLSPTTQRYAYSVLRIALGRAVKEEVIHRNPAVLVDPPAKARATITPLTLEQTQAFLRSLEGDRLAALYITAIGTGLRQGELLALRWDEDVDLDDAVLRVRSTLERGTRAVAEPKTKESIRNVALPAFVVDALRAHRARQREEKMEHRRTWEEGGFVFTTPTGRPLDGSNVTHALHRSLDRAGLPRQRFHDLRHGHATLSLEAGVPLEVVSRNLGHSSIRTTTDTYVTIRDGRRREAADRLGAAIVGQRTAV